MASQSGDAGQGAISDGAAGAVPDPAAEGAPNSLAGPAGRAASPIDQSLSAVLGELDRAGWAGQFMPLEGGSIRCLTCRHEFPAGAAVVEESRRLEGVSDPADMVIVVPLTCPNCGTRGVLTAHYGAEASPEESDVVAAMARPNASEQSSGDAPGPSS